MRRRSGSLFDATIPPADQVEYDVAERWYDESGQARRCRVWDDASEDPQMRLVRTIDLHPEADENETEVEGDR